MSKKGFVWQNTSLGEPATEWEKYVAWLGRDSYLHRKATSSGTGVQDIADGLMKMLRLLGQELISDYPSGNILSY